MAIEKIDSFILLCDNCKGVFQNSNDFSIFPLEGDIRSEVGNSNSWIEDKGKYYCGDCHEIDDNDNIIIK